MGDLLVHLNGPLCHSSMNPKLNLQLHTEIHFHFYKPQYNVFCFWTMHDTNWSGDTKSVFLILFFEKKSYCFSLVCSNQIVRVCGSACDPTCHVSVTITSPFATDKVDVINVDSISSHSAATGGWGIIVPESTSSCGLTSKRTISPFSDVRMCLFTLRGTNLLSWHGAALKNSYKISNIVKWAFSKDKTYI